MPLEKIHQLFNERQAEIDNWFESRWQGLRPLPYFSCDVRHGAFKIGVVDTNLFPAGFNNLCNAFTKETAKAFDAYFTDYHPGVKNILLYGENHTRNKYYLLNLIKLKALIEAGNRNCRITLPLDRYPEPRVTVALDETNTIVIEECKVINGIPTLADEFGAELVLSNNDFSSGTPKLLADVTVPITPSRELGWSHRTKSRHFELLTEVITEFCTDFSFDPWELLPVTRSVTNVTAENLAGLAETVDSVLEVTAKKYAEYDVTETPYVFIKNDSGTYGLGIVTATSGAEVLAFNRKKREKLFSGKAGNQTHRFMVQEGIPTVDTYSEFPIEPVIYGVGKLPIGGFFRLHEDKNPFESLNAPGMSFSCLCLHKLDEPHESYFLKCKDKLSLVFGAKFVARFAALAAAMEVHA